VRVKCNRCGIKKKDCVIVTESNQNKFVTPISTNNKTEIENSTSTKINFEKKNNLETESKENINTIKNVERQGDWVCVKCKNLNFSFRVVCNRCQISKTESDNLFKKYMQNLMHYGKINESFQNHIRNQLYHEQNAKLIQSNCYPTNDNLLPENQRMNFIPSGFCPRIDNKFYQEEEKSI